MTAPQTKRSMPFGIPSPASVQDYNTRATLEAIIANLQVLHGVSGKSEDWAVTRRDLLGSSSHAQDPIGRLVFDGGTGGGGNGGASASVVTSPGVTMTISQSITGDVATVTVNVFPAGVYVMAAWLSDDAAGGVSSTVPDVSNVADWGTVITNASGVRVFTIEHTGVKTWYFRAAPLGVPSATAAVAMS